MRLSLLFICILYIAKLEAQVHIPFGINDFPDEDRTYVPLKDLGMYQAKALYGTKKVVLTYDDGPHQVRTPLLLDLSKKYGVTATFFIVKQNITPSTIPIIERMLNDGHIVASHGLSHLNSNTEDEEAYGRDLTTSILALEEITANMGIHRTEMYYRFPYGDYGKNKFYHQMNVMKSVSQKLYNENCINFVFWDIDTADWVPSSTPGTISNSIIAHIVGGTAYTHTRKNPSAPWTLKPYQITNPPAGGIILMHDIHLNTLKGTELFLEYAQKNNVRVVPLSTVENFSYDGKSCIIR